MDSVDPKFLISGEEYPTGFGPMVPLPPSWFVNREINLVVTYSHKDGCFLAFSLDITTSQGVGDTFHKCLKDFVEKAEETLIMGYGGVHYGKTSVDVQIAEINRKLFYDEDDAELTGTTVTLFKNSSPYYRTALKYTDFPIGYINRFADMN
jgi:hypothetical protein